MDKRKSDHGGWLVLGSLALSILAWRLYVLMMEDELRSAYNFGNNAAKWIVVSFAESFTMMVALPIVIAFPIAWIVKREVKTAYRIALLVAAVWTALSLFGLSKTV